MEEILEKARRVSQWAEVYSVSRQETTAVFEANRLKQVHTRSGSSNALRLAKDGRIGFATANRKDSTQKLVDMALETAAFGATARFEPPSGASYPQVEVYDPGVEAIPIDKMVEIGERLVARIRGASPDILCEASVSKAVFNIAVRNSTGGHSEYKKSIFSFGIEGTLIRGSDMLFVGDGEAACFLQMDPEPVASAVVLQLRRAERLVPAPSGRLPVIFTPEAVAGVLLYPLALAFNGKVVLQGASPLGNKKGQRVFDPRLSIWDDATVPLRAGSRCCDDEAVPCRRNALVENGVVKSFLYDLQTAAMAGVASTGSASRSGGQPRPATSTVVFSHGDTTFEQMVKDVKEGLVVEQLMGATQSNVLSGDFSGNVLLGYKVEGGEIVGRVKDTMVSGNVYEILKELAGIGAERKWVGGTLLAPPLYCSNLAVAVKS
ncbi:MAG: metallopeptidase TldD-related protein [Dehalococcoidia bacterium]|nr:metallopeptidase TldD-related protein [Dehalococcoidia bacterium]